MSEMKTLGDNVDDLIRTIARVGHMTTQEAVDFIIWRVKNYQDAFDESNDPKDYRGMK